MSCTQLNFLSAMNFTFELSKTPGVSFYGQQASLPGINIGEVPVGTPFTRFTEFGQMEYDNLAITFKIDEMMQNYLEVYNWMVELSTPDRFEQADHTKYDGTLIIFNNSKKPQISITYHDIFPVSLSPIMFDTTLTEVQYLDATASFSFDRMFFSVL